MFIQRLPTIGFGCRDVVAKLNFKKRTEKNRYPVKGSMNKDRQQSASLAVVDTLPHTCLTT